MLAAKLRDRRACLMLLQYPDNLLFCETVALHSLVLSIGQSLLQNGLVQRGKVRGECQQVSYLGCILRLPRQPPETFTIKIFT